MVLESLAGYLGVAALSLLLLLAAWFLRGPPEKAASADSKASDLDAPLKGGSGEQLNVQRIHSTASGMMMDPPREEDGEDKRPVCGLAPGWGSKQMTVERFGSALQRMIMACRREREQTRIRIFDDYTAKDSLDGVAMTLTETRCTQFGRIRRASRFTEEEYCHSMCAQKFSGGKIEASGKSGSFFMQTHDKKLLLKTIEEHEFVCLTDILPHMVLFLETHVDSLLCRFLGAYSLDIGGNILRFAVMSSCLPLPQSPLEVYDLKGTTEDRWVNPTPGCTLKDNNFQGNRLLFPSEHSSALQQLILDDAEFLLTLGVMDYSLLVGVTPLPEGSEPTPRGHCATVMRGWLEGPDGRTPYVFQLGIIDYLQRWTPKKVAAHWLKKATLGCYHEIDTEPPAVYCKRFYKYFFKKIQPVAQ